MISGLLTLFLMGELLALVLGVASWCWCRKRKQSVEPVSAGPVFDVVVPVLGAPDHFATCLDAVKDQLPPGSTLWIVHQCCRPEERLPVPDDGRVRLVRLYERPGKIDAIRRALPHICKPWVLLLDADTVLAPGALAHLVASADRYDAVYGIIVPRPASRTGLLHRVVQIEKLLSHGIWRLGRWVLRLGPNLPGQCYLVRTALLRRLYHRRLGYLDDVIFTAWLMADGGRVGFAPVVAGEELSRETWRGLFAQRIRFSMGIGQGFWGLLWCRGRRWRAWQYLSLHTWLYYGAPMLALLLSLALLGAAQRWAAVAVIGMFVLNRCVLAGIAVANLRRMGVSRDAVWPGSALVPAVVLLAMVVLAGACGAVVAACVGMARRSVPALYHR